MTIRRKLIFGFAGITLLIGAIGYISIVLSQRTMAEYIQSVSERMVSEALHKIEVDFADKIESFTLRTSEEQIQRVVKESNREFAGIQSVYQVIEERDREWRLSSADSSAKLMDQIYSNELSRSLREIQDFYNKKYGNRVIGEIFVTNGYGVNVAMTGRASDYRQDDEEWWDHAKNEGLCQCGVRIDSSAGTYSSNVAISINDSSGTCIGVMKVVFNIERLTSLIAHTQDEVEYKSARYVLIDSLGRSIYDETGKYGFLQDISKSEFYFQLREKLRENMSSGLGRPRGHFLTEKNLIAVAASADMRGLDDMGWILALQLDSEEVFRPVSELRTWIIIVSVTLTLLAMIMGFIIANSSSRPLMGLAEYVAEIEKGNLSPVLLTENTSGEEGEFIRAYQRMATDLRSSMLSIAELKTEIVERKKVETQLRDGEGRFKELFNSAPIPYVLLTPQGIIQRVNSAFCKLLGRSAEDLLERSFGEDLTAESGSEISVEVFLRRSNSGEAIRDEMIRILHSDGTGIWCDLAIEPLVDETGATVANIVSAIDVTDRLRSQEEIRKRDELLRAALESTADGILVVDETGKVTHWNKRFVHLFRIPTEVMNSRDDNKLIGTVLSQLLEPERFTKKVEQLYLSFDEDWDTLYFKDGRVFDRYSCPLIIKTELKGRVWSFRDVTDRLEDDEKRRNLQEQLDRAERMESLGLLAGGVAHDLNNTLGPLVGYPDLILKQLPIDSPIRKQISRIGKAAKDAANVVQDLLALARRGRYQMTPLCVNDVIEDYFDSASYIQLSEDRPDVTVTVDLDTDLGNIEGSKPHLAKVVLNLMMNAYDAMPDGGQISVITSHCNLTSLYSGYDGFERGKYVVLRIKDNGAGMEEETREKIFEPYFSKKTIGASGTGLGLAVVYGILKDHKGFYDVYSAPGKGAEFILYFPATEEEQISSTSTTEALGGSQKILIVDDLKEQRELATAMLSSLGYIVESVDSGHSAVEFLKQNDFDLVLLDMIMEDNFDGLDTYREILKSNKTQKAIIVSGYSATGRVQRMLELGASGYVKKPYTRAELGSEVQNALDQSFVTSAV